MFRYTISGLDVLSEMELPSAIRAHASSGEPDVVIRFGDVPAHLTEPEREGPDWAVHGDTFLLHLPGALRALLWAGKSMLLKVEPGHLAADLALYIMGTCFAVILQQRGRVVLHASAVAVNGRAMLFCGASGAGKSTMAALLNRRGYPLLNDDVCNLSRTGSGEYVVYPDGRMLKLWSPSLQHLSLEGSAGARIRRDTEKFYTPPEQMDHTPRTVGGVYVLQALDDGHPVQLTRLSTAESMAELMGNAYRPGLVQAMQMTPAYFQASIAIQRQAGVYRLSRAMDFSRAEQALDLLEHHWASIHAGPLS